MKHILLLSLLFFFSINSPISATENYIIIVNPSNPASEISKKELIDIFHIKKNRWNDGTEIKPANLGINNPVRISLSSEILNKSIDEMESYYLKQITKQNFLPPKRFETDAEVLKFVSSNKGGIGYVSKADGSVKVIPVKGFFSQDSSQKEKNSSVPVVSEKKSDEVVTPAKKKEVIAEPVQEAAQIKEVEVPDTITPFFETGKYLIIVNPKNPVSKLSKKELSDIFKGKTRTWPDGSKIMLVNLKKDSEMMKSYYKSKGSSDSALVPISFDTEEDVIKSVSINKRSIGYVTHEDNSVKVVTVEGLSFERRVSTAPQIEPVKEVKSEKAAVEDPVIPLFDKGKYLIIVNPKNPVSNFSKEELVDIYKSKKLTWPSGEKIMLVTLNKDAEDIKSYYKRNGISEASLTASFATEADVIKFVSINKRSIGYVSNGDKSVKVVPVGELSSENKEASVVKPEIAEPAKSEDVITQDKSASLFIGKYQIIVNNKNSISNVTNEELIEIYKGQKKNWADGSKIIPVYNKRDAEIIKSYFEKNVVKDAFAAHMVLDNDADILKFITVNKRSIGYVLTPNSSVKVVSAGASAVSKDSPQAAKVEPVKPVKPLPAQVAEKKEPEKAELILPASISSLSNQVFKVHDPLSNEASAIVVTNPSFSKKGKSPITASGDIKIHIPESLGLEWDSSVSSLVITGDAAKNVKNKVTYSKDNKVLIIDVIKDFASKESIQIMGMKFIKFNLPSEKGDYLWMEVNNSATKEDEDDKSIEIKSGRLTLVITEPLKKSSNIGSFVSGITSATKVAGKAFDLEIYIVNEDNKRVDISGEVTFKDQWISPANPQVQKHISLDNGKVEVKNGYARVSMEYPEAGKIKVIAEKDTTVSSAEFEINFKPNSLNLTVQACAISGKSTDVVVTAVNANGLVTANYEGSFYLDSKFAAKQSSAKPLILPAPGTKIALTGGRAEVALLYEDSGSILINAIESEKSGGSQLITSKPEMICFRPASFLIKSEPPPSKREYFYTSDSTCKTPEYVDLAVSAVNEKGKLVENFEGTVSFLEAANGVFLPKPQIFSSADKGVKLIRGKFYSSVEHSVEPKVTGVMASKGCTCSTITGAGKPVVFKQGNIVIASKTGAASGLTRQKAGNIVQISRTGGSSHLEVPVSLKFNNGEVITSDSETKVFVQVESESGKVNKSVSINGDGSFVASKGVGNIIMSDSEGEIVKLKAASKPCLAQGKGTITFVDDKLIVLATSGGFNEDVSVKIEIRDSTGKITNRYDGMAIDDIALEPNKNYILKGSAPVVIKNGLASITLRNNNPKSEKSELILVKPNLTSAPLVVQPAKIRFTSKSGKSESSFDLF